MGKKQQPGGELAVLYLEDEDRKVFVRKPASHAVRWCPQRHTSYMF